MNPIKVWEVEDFWAHFGGVVSQYSWALVCSRNGLNRWCIASKSQSSIACDHRIIVEGHDWSAENLAIPDVDLLIGFGGGFVIDAAKHLAFRTLQARCPSIIAIPSLAGSGSEVTHFASVWSGGQKSSIEDPSLRPAHVFRVPQFALGAPLKSVVPAALDALSHALESVWNIHATNDTDNLAVAAIRELAPVLGNLGFRMTNLQEQACLMRASTLAGQAIAVTRTALAHSISYPLTGELGMPHGLASSIALPQIAAFNMETEAARLAPIASALACEVHQIPEVLETILRDCELQTHFMLPDPLVCLELSEPFASSARATNNIRSADEAQARQIIFRALEARHV